MLIRYNYIFKIKLQVMSSVKVFRLECNRAWKNKRARLEINEWTLFVVIWAFFHTNESKCEVLSWHAGPSSGSGVHGWGCTSPRSHQGSDASPPACYQSRTCWTLWSRTSWRRGSKQKEIQHQRPLDNYLNRVQFCVALPSDGQGTWTWLSSEPRSRAPCSGPLCAQTWWPGQCAHGPLCPEASQTHHAYQSGAWKTP